jgi:hypothetical protein
MKQQRVLIHVVEILIWKQNRTIQHKAYIFFQSKVENGCTFITTVKKSNEKGMRWVIAFAHF